DFTNILDGIVEILSENIISHDSLFSLILSTSSNETHTRQKSIVPTSTISVALTNTTTIFIVATTSSTTTFVTSATTINRSGKLMIWFENQILKIYKRNF
ncbi:hypothetical protein C5167_034124, partial [Papaver somniferum]